MQSRLHKSLFPILRRMSDGEFHSGEALGEAFQLSRGSVFNILGQAEALGLAVHAVRGKGYRIPAQVEWLDRSAVNAHLGLLARSYDVAIHDSVESTNSTLMQAALQGAPNGSVVCAEHQQAGRGRRGRQWQAALGGGLTFSILSRFEAGLSSMAGLSLVMGLTIARVVNRHSRHPARLKWPNDVLVGYRKLAGILVEVQGDMDGAAYAVIGIGINVSLNASQRESIDQPVVDLAEMGVSLGRNQLLAECLRELDAVMAVFREQGFAGLRQEWMDLDAYAGKEVSLLLPNTQAVHGVAAGVDDTGAFLLRDREANLKAYNGGEISLRLGDRR
jgi:BirA family biotin operon repressor/biotin-[acetyl-CoA-carboxylase] ligase